ncbi:hypothetical protein COU56_00875 [Candidatus Pacearchaeota archaeon CG10_big_fil_rev_8_21_14_0_10_31_9]|nr:MAG: hypothetical protein COU56_00875 [Candidatus Pacearchaeota archaeon CG10_big_fil_rev_8_21_14_0_10_31_9]PIZ83575.1 MAG: hypothetical protein COX97_00885 [Candidatus Pacearchaeota archaeon CG_4_10_14_0_2_um_filter_05_32_18]
MSELIEKIGEEMAGVLSELSNSLNGKIADHDGFIRGIDSLVKQGMFSLAYNTVQNIDECPDHIKEYFKNLKEKQNKFDEMLNTYSRFGSQSPCFEGFY